MVDSLSLIFALHIFVFRAYLNAQYVPAVYFTYGCIVVLFVFFGTVKAAELEGLPYFRCLRDQSSAEQTSRFISGEAAPLLY